MNKLYLTKNFYLVIALLSILSLISAIYIEYIIGIKPCKLCLYQRVPYILSIFLCFIGYGNIKNKIWLYLLITVFLISGVLAGYHVGIENNIFPEFSGCAANNLDIMEKDELLNSLKNSVPNCKNINFKLAGFSLATINLFISSSIVVISTKLLTNEKNR